MINTNTINKNTVNNKSNYASVMLSEANTGIQYGSFNQPDQCILASAVNQYIAEYKNTFPNDNIFQSENVLTDPTYTFIRSFWQCGGSSNATATLFDTRRIINVYRQPKSYNGITVDNDPADPAKTTNNQDKAKTIIVIVIIGIVLFMVFGK